MDHGYLGDIGKHTWHPRGARQLVRYSGLDMWLATASRDRRLQLWPWIQQVCGLLYCVDEEALLEAVQCVPSPWTFNDNNPSSTHDAAYGDPRSTGMSFLELAEKERPTEKSLQLELQLWWSVTDFDTHTDTDTSWTKWASTTEQAAMSPCI